MAMIFRASLKEHFLKPLVFNRFERWNINKSLDLSTISGFLGTKTLTSALNALSLQGFNNSINLNFNKMNKAQLIEAIAKDAKMTKVEAHKALGAVITATTKALSKGDRVALIGFGSFSVSKRAARKGRNPQTGKEIKIAAKKVVKFKAGAELTKKVK